MGTMQWQPAWWNEHHASAWERAKEAMRRDWEQTKHDLKMKGGHELNQSVGDTVKQASGKEEIPIDDRPNPPKVIGQLRWDEVEIPMGYGYGARDQYRQHASWTPELEDKLRREWESDGQSSAQPGRVWPEVRDHVRRGFEAKH